MKLGNDRYFFKKEAIGSYVSGTGKGNRFGNTISQSALEIGIQIPKECPEIFRNAGYRIEKIQDGDFYRFLFLARLQEAWNVAENEKIFLEKENRKEYRARQRGFEILSKNRMANRQDLGA